MRLRNLVSATPILRDLAATAQGLRASRRRYGAVFRETAPQIAERSAWPQERMRGFCLRLMRSFLRYAVTNIPHYRATLGPGADDVGSLEEMAHLPMLSKDTVRANPRSLTDERLSPRMFERLSTSGTSGTPIELFRTREAAQASYAYFEVRCRRVAGMRFGEEPYAMIGGQLVAPVTRRRPPFWCYNYAWKQLYLSSYHLSDEFLGAYVAEIRRRDCRAIMGYPSSLHAVARRVLERGDELPPMRCAITSSETLLDHQRADIERAFGCRVHDQYGAGELCVFAAQCAAGGMHLSPDYGWVEVVDEAGKPVAPGVVGEAVCTSLVNFGQVFIRYRLGDRLSLGEGGCPCESPLPLIASLEGRTDKVLITRDGRRIGRLDPVFKGVEHVRECQIVQESADRFLVRVVPAPGYIEADGAMIRKNLLDRVGPAEARVQVESSIERTSAGKFEAVVNRCAGTPPAP